MAFSYVRTLEFTVSSMKILFNDDVDTNVGIGNVSITSIVDSINNPDIRSVSVDGSIIAVTFQPIFPNIQYKITFFSSDTQSFQTVNGNRISEDGRRNSFFVTSPGEAESPIRDSMFEDVGTLYTTDEPTLVRELISSTANSFQKVSESISTTRSANYISVLVTDESKIRDDGPVDKLNNGGAFEILRVARSRTGSTKPTYFEFNNTREQTFKTRNNIIVNSIINSLTDDSISLQAVDVVNEKVTDDIDANNYFNGLRIKVANGPVIQVISVSLLRNGQYTEYDIELFGYTLRTNKYNTITASVNANLSDYEIDLSSGSITETTGGFLIPRAGDEIYVSYIYKKLGRDVNPDTVSISRVLSAVRETTPAILNRFTITHSPIVTVADEVPSRNGVEFLNTQPYNGQQAFTTVHPAFLREIPYDIAKFPARVGEWTINYETGEVFVFGEDINNRGTGENPPVANYKYRQVFVEDLDFTFNSDRDEVAINSTRGLAGLEAKISFDYEDTFAVGSDFRIASHVEVLSERVNNKLTGDFKVETSNFPITDVFRIFNETTGELYDLDRFNDTSISFNGRRAPKQMDIKRERTTFTRIPQEVLLVSDELENGYGLKIFKVDLENSGITGSQGRFIGSNFDTSVLFSKTDVFVREFFYEDRLFQNVTTNINRLEIVGDYSIDYTNGIVYVAVDNLQGTDLGDITYQHKKITTINKHILSVNNIYRSISSLQNNIKTYSIGTVTDSTISIIGLENVGERFINDNPTRSLVVGTYQNGEDGITSNGSNVFTSNSAIFTSDDIGRTLLVGAGSSPPSQDVLITGIINDHEVTVTPAFNYTKNGRVWTVLDLSSGAAKTITLEHDIAAVKNIYTVTQLGTMPSEDLDGYFDIDRDSVSGNVITLGSSNPLQIGDAIIVNYNFGDLFVDYRYLQDNLVLSYEYGNNSLDWSISSALNPGDEYYVTYKYGALRDPLLLNFGSLTQIPQLTTFSPNLNRETYRSVVAGTLQSFIEGPTVPSLERLVEAFTDVKPNISEVAFNNWILGRDYLHLRKPEYNATQIFDLGRFDNGVVISDNQNIKVPALAHIRLDEGTLEAWIRPSWSGMANDASIIFNSLTIDGYSDPKNVFIGFAGNSPTSIPFTVNKDDTVIPVLGEPTNISNDTGFFIWFDDITNMWHIRWRESTDQVVEFDGSMSTSGEFFNVIRPIGNDGYEINEITDIITSTIDGIEFNAFIDGYDELVPSQYAMDGISFAAGDSHYIFDMSEAPATNGMSLFKDGTGYLNFQVFDNRRKFKLPAGFYNISKNIRDWEANSLHHIAASWKFNSPEEMDEMHMFVDGEEVTNLFKYGGNPKGSSSFDFGDVAEETLVNYALRPIINGLDGSSTTGSSLFLSDSADFTVAGVQVGDTFRLLDDTADGIGDPNFGLLYTITGVGTTSLTLDRALTLTLGDLKYSINSVTATVTTPINFQDFVVVAIDSDGNETELYGVSAELPDYTVSRGANSTHVITVNNRVKKYDTVVIKPLGLILRRCKEKVYVYDGGYDEIRLNSSAPVTLSDVRITEIILDGTLIRSGSNGFSLIGVIIGSQLVTKLQSYLDDVCQPSNQSSGRKLSVKLSGDNFNYNITGNQVIIEGETYSGATTETLLFTDSDTITTSGYWKRIDSVTVSVIPIDASQSVGSVEIREYQPITISENNGDFAEVVEYSNGIIRLETYGTAGDPFILNGCMYEVDYPSFLRIKVDAVPDMFYIGSNHESEQRFDGVIDEFRILDYMSVDTRAGEALASNTRSITTDYNASQSFAADSNTLLLMNFNNATEDSSTYRDRYDNGFEVGQSVSDEFGTAIKVSTNKPYVVNNANSIFNPNEGTIEFWLNPLDDSRGDPNYHNYVDMSAVVEETLESTTKLTVTTSQKIREVESVRLATDIYNTGTNYFTGGSISNIDYKTIRLGIPLPFQNILLKVVYVPSNSQGDRVSIFRDPYGRINFFVKASSVEHLISVPTTWSRHTWHRIMVMWKTNSSNNQDRLRLFVDGSERGTIRYGTGLKYGTGVIWGQAEVRPGTNRFLVDNIDLTDTFAKIYIGTDVYGFNGARALIDNIRFSEIQRLNGIKIASNDTIDMNYSANTDSASPVVEDLYTKLIINFDKIEQDIEFLATVINAERGIYRFKVEVIDSFDKVIGNTELEELLVDLINTIKPAHTEAIITFRE